MHGREYYVRLRKRFLPDEIRLVFVAESPPISGKYFYDPGGSSTEPIFRALLQAVLAQRPTAKAEGLRAFAQAGYLLVDATYRPVNALTGKERNRIILADYPRLRRDLIALLGGHDGRILLIKANVCRLLEERLLADGFNVVNHGIVIPFPGSGHYREFLEKMPPLLRRTI